MGHLAKQKYERMPLALNVIQKKVLCSAEKSSVIWAKPHSRSSAEPNIWLVTNLKVCDINVVGEKMTSNALNALRDFSFFFLVDEFLIIDRLHSFSVGKQQ